MSFFLLLLLFPSVVFTMSPLDRDFLFPDFLVPWRKTRELGRCGLSVHNPARTIAATDLEIFTLYEAVHRLRSWMPKRVLELGVGKFLTRSAAHWHPSKERWSLQSLVGG